MDAYTFSIGAFDCIAVNDGDMDYDASDYVANAGSRRSATRSQPTAISRIAFRPHTAVS